MMETKHTPGPWFYAGKHDDCEVRYVGLNVEDHFFGEIAVLYGAEGREQEANDRLIAAAPELLNALSNLLATVERVDIRDGVCCCGESMEGHDNPMNCGHSPVDAGQYYGSQSIAEAEAAIAKATGAA